MPLKKLLKNRGGLSRMKATWAVQREPYSNKLTYDELVNAEAALGRTLFGPVPVGHEREFFEHKKNVWIWHESFIDAAGVEQDLTIRYEVRPTGVYKKSVGTSWTQVEGKELDNFRNAARSYFKLVKERLYS